MYVLRNDKEFVATGDQIRSIHERLDVRSAKNKDRRILKGVIASKGRVQGVCKIVIRADTTAQKFQQGAILVSEATDPDLLNLVRIAGGVLTQQGGVTAHAAIICREIGVPAIIGIEGLLDSVKDGDVVELDAYTGTVKLLQSPDEPPPGVVFEPDVLKDPSRVGAKASNLARLASLAYAVPPFVVLEADGLRRYLSSTNPSQNLSLSAWLRRRLCLSEESSVAIRSSAIGEDTAGHSLAGEFDSVLDVPVVEIVPGIEKFLWLNKLGKSGQMYRGAVVIQEMITGEVGGVALTEDADTGDSGTIVYEMSKGGAATVTSGKSTPARIRVRKDTLDIIQAAPSEASESLFGREVIGELGRIVVDIERLFGQPVDVEWVKKGSTFYVLQARPIVRLA